MDQVSDPSLVYVCEKGMLYTPHSKRPRSFESCSSRFLKRFQSDENRSSDCKESTSDQLSSPLRITEVASLKSLAMSFVAQNILSVDSLVSFPEPIGEELFLAVNRLGLLSTPTKTCKLILRLFIEAYGSSVAEELSLESKVSNLEFCFEPLTSFEHLTKLDLGGCKLWNLNDECLAFVSSLSSLNYLSLKSTGIDNYGLRILTTVIAVYKRGLLQLKVLDLSYNQLINQKSLQFLRRFPALKALNLNNTNVLSISQEEQKNLHLTLLGENLEYPFGKISVRNKGWVGGIVSDWIAEEVRRVNARAACRSQPSLSLTAQDRLSASNFYRRSKASLSRGLDKKNSVAVDEASKPCVKFSSEDCGTKGRTVHLVSAELIEEIDGIERVKDLSDPSTGIAEAESTSESCARVKLHSFDNESLDRCVMKIIATGKSSDNSEDTFVSQSLSVMRNALPDDATCKVLQGEVTAAKKTVSGDRKRPLSSNHKSLRHTKSINENCAYKLKTKTEPKSLWAAMNSGLW